MDPQELKSNKLRFSGPNWLCDVGTQGREDRDVLMPEECLTEIKAKHRQEVIIMLTSDNQCGLDQIMKCEGHNDIGAEAS